MEALMFYVREKWKHSQKYLESEVKYPTKES